MILPNKTLLLFISVALVTSSAFAASPPFGPEIPISVATTHVAPHLQTSPEITWNGTDFLVTWADARRAPYGGGTTVHATTLDVNGNLEVPFGFNLSEPGAATQIAPTIGGYLVASYSPQGIFVRHVGTNLQPIAPEIRVASFPQFPIDLSASGDFFLLTKGAQGPASTAIMATLLDARGVPIGEMSLGTAQELIQEPLTGGRFVVLTREVNCDGVNPCTTSLRYRLLTRTGAVVDRVIATGLSFYARPTVAVAGERILVAWTAEGFDAQQGAVQTLDYMILSPTGDVVTPVQRVFRRSVSTLGGGFPPVAASDGMEFLIGWSTNTGGADRDSRIDAVRVSFDGRILNETPIRFGGPNTFDFDVEVNGRTIVVVTQEGFFPETDIFARRVTRFADLATAPALLLSRSATMQNEPRVATIGERGLAVWREASIVPGIHAAPFTVGESAVGSTRVLLPVGVGLHHSPAVAASGSIFLVVWRDVRETFDRIVAMRVSSAGDPMDAAPILVAHMEGTSAGLSEADIGVASDGTNFLVTWVHNGNVYAAGVTPAGAVIDDPPLTLPRGPFYRALSPRAVWTGDHYLVVWGNETSNPFLLSPPVPSTTAIEGVRITREGLVIDRTPIRIFEGPGGNYEVALAWSGRRAMLVWSSLAAGRQCFYALPLTANAVPFGGTARAIDCHLAAGHGAFESSGPRPDIVWDGRRFIASNTTMTQPDRSTDLFYLDEDAIVTTGFDDALPATWDAVLAAAAGRATVVYTRWAGEAQYGGAPRVFLRSFVIPGGVRVRSVRP